jgi:hypothetical protein
VAQEARDRLCVGVHEAWRDRDFARLRTPVAKTGWGPRRRYFPTPPSKEIGAAEWHALLPLPGGEGGMTATPCSTAEWEAAYFAHVEALQDTPLVADANMHAQAVRDVNNTVNGLISARKRRAAPEWSHVPEAFLMALRPSMLTRQRERPRAPTKGSDALLQGPLHDEYRRYLAKYPHIRPCLPDTASLTHVGYQGLGYRAPAPSSVQAFQDKFI